MVGTGRMDWIGRTGLEGLDILCARLWTARIALVRLVLGQFWTFALLLPTGDGFVARLIWVHFTHHLLPPALPLRALPPPRFGSFGYAAYAHLDLYPLLPPTTVLRVRFARFAALRCTRVFTAAYAVPHHHTAAHLRRLHFP